MMSARTPSVEGFLVGLQFTGAAFAREADLGTEINMDRCAVCHGETGSGDGMVGALFASKPKDLTMLTKKNGGAFPSLVCKAAFP